MIMNFDLRPTRVGHLLQYGFGTDKLVDGSPQRSRPIESKGVLVDQRFEYEGGVAGPGIEVVRVGGGRRCYHLRRCMALSGGYA